MFFRRKKDSVCVVAARDGDLIVNSRRTLLKTGVALTIPRGLLCTAFAQTRSSMVDSIEPAVVDFAVVDQRFSGAPPFVEEARQRGVFVHVIDGNVTDLWLHLSQHRHRLRSLTLMGLTT